MVTLAPATADFATPRGAVLISYVLDPFLLADRRLASHDHTHHWEAVCIAEAFVERGFEVDIVSYNDRQFVPAKPYQVFLAARTNLARIADHLAPECLKIAHLDTAHWLTNNSNSLARLLDVQQRRSVTLTDIKTIEENMALEQADIGTVLGNQFTMDSYAYAKKPIHRLPISVPLEYDFPEDRDLSIARNGFIWFGSSGFVHKGLDLVLEAFASLPEQHLYICGPFDDEPAFMRAYQKELCGHDNIHALGWVDVAGEEFKEIVNKSVGVVFPSCAEGGGGSVISCMHAGLIPLVTPQASVDIGDFGIEIDDFSAEAVRSAVKRATDAPVAELEQRCRASWEHVRSEHTRPRFKQNLDNLLDELLPNEL